MRETQRRCQIYTIETNVFTDFFSCFISSQIEMIVNSIVTLQIFQRFGSEIINIVIKIRSVILKFQIIAKLFIVLQGNIPSIILEKIRLTIVTRFFVQTRLHLAFFKK